MEAYAGRYLIGTPLLGDYLEEGLSQLGIRWRTSRSTASSLSGLCVRG